MIVGLTGTLASGKSSVSELFKKRSFVCLSLSEELREICRNRKTELTRKNLQDTGNKLREEEGHGVLAKLVVRRILEGDYKDVLVDGIRNPAEIKELRKLKNFFLVAIDAPVEERFERIRKRRREREEEITFEEFKATDERDRGVGEPKGGQAVSKCMAMADFELFNDGGVIELDGKVNYLYSKIEERLAEFGKIDPVYKRPSWDEYFLEIAETVSKRATCDRGRSGCVIAKNKQILVTGYVGSPKGLAHCDDVGHQYSEVIHPDGSKRNHCVRTTHAEQNAICQAAKTGISIDSAILYCSMTPCSVCAKMIINSGIKRVVCLKKYHAGAESEKLFRQAGVELEILNEDFAGYSNQYIG